MSEPPPSPLYRWGVLCIIMLGTFMAILDSSIVNVALPLMMSAFGVTRDRIEWVATGFMISSAVVMPLMGWLTGRLGFKLLYLGALGVFTIGSLLCAMAWSYESLVFARVLQAAGGGAIQPVGMAIVASLFEPHERGRALGVWGTGIMVAPALGPTLGGYLSDAFGWRSIFSVNLPVGVVTLVVGMLVMRHHRPAGPRRPLDVAGYGFLAMGLVAGLIALSNGQEKGWDSDYIRIAAALSAIGIVMFLAIESAVEHPLLDLRLLRIRNYWLSMVLAVFRAIGLFGSVFLLPLFLESVVGYTTIQTGLWLIPGAAAVGVTMPIAGRLADRHRPAVLVTIGTILVGVSLLMFSRLDPRSDWVTIVVPQLVRGAGLALMMAPLLTAALNSVPQRQVPAASGFLNVAQQVGGAMGIALMNNHVTVSIQQHAVRLGEAFPPQSPAFCRMALAASDLLFRRAPGMLATEQFKSVFFAGQGLMFRARVSGFDDGFVFAGLVMLCAVPLSLFLQTIGQRRRPALAAE